MKLTAIVSEEKLLRGFRTDEIGILFQIVTNEDEHEKKTIRDKIGTLKKGYKNKTIYLGSYALVRCSTYSRFHLKCYA